MPATFSTLPATPETDPVASPALTAHAAATTGVHGISDTATLATTAGTIPRGKIWIPDYNNFGAANADPATLVTTGTALGSGSTFYAKVRVGSAFTANFAYFYVGTAAVGSTYSDFGLMRLDGTLLADVDITTAMTSTGLKKVALTALFTGALALPSDSVAYGTWLGVGQTTSPILAKPSAGNIPVLSNAGLVASDGYRWAVATGQTTIPTSPAPTAATISGIENWMALSAT